MSEHKLQPHYRKTALYLFLILQFFTAFADNALLFAEISILKNKHSPSWEIPMLQDFFIIGYILLAPFVAIIADKWSKKYVLFGANILKIVGVIMLGIGINPLLCCVVIGIGCATFSPAKYGVLPELVEPHEIVKANGYLEVATISAVLLGVMAGGIVSDHSTNDTIYLIIGLILFSLVVNLFIPHIPAANSEQKLNPVYAIKEFSHSFKVAIKNKEIFFSIINTSIFGSSASTLRFLLVAWVPIALHETTNKDPALLNSFVAVGLAIGAILAGKYINTKNTGVVSFCGALLGIFIIILANVTSLQVAFGTMLIIGVLGGIFVIPLNANVQEIGKKTIGSGHSVAIQNFCENILMLIMIGGYSYLLKVHSDVIDVAMVLGVFLTASIALLGLWKNYSNKRTNPI